MLAEAKINKTLRQTHITCFYIHSNEVSGKQVDVGQAANYHHFIESHRVSELKRNPHSLLIYTFYYQT